MELFGRYVLLERIGSGGMAEVFRGLSVGQAGFARTVAVKRLLPHMAQDEEIQRMLAEEARLVAAIRHPNVVPVLDLGEQGGTYFLAMDYVPGRPLKQVVVAAQKAGSLPPPLAVFVVREVLSGLAHVHAMTDADGRPLNLIHRDISPDNVMVGFDGRVMVMDFGVARAEDQARTTLAGSLRGKPAYMSPELVRGDPVSQAVDLYAAAVVLWETLALSPMRQAASDVQMLSVVAKGEVPSLASRGVDVPADLEAFLARALHADPAARFPNAQAMVVALDMVASSHGWHWGAPETAAWLAEHLPQDLAEETEAGARARKLARKMGGASPRALQRMVAEANGQRVGPPPWVWAAALVGVGAVGLLLAPRWSTPPPPPPPPLPVENMAPPPPPPPPVPQEPWTTPVRSTPAGARVSVGGAVVGTTPMDLVIPPGQVLQVEVALEGYRPREFQLAHADRPAAVDAALEALGPGSLSLQTTPWGKVKIDGKDTGAFTPLTNHPLPAGRHVVEVVNPELGVRARFEVDIRPGQTTRVARRLR